MAKTKLTRALAARVAEQERLLRRRNVRLGDRRWVLDRYRDPVVTAEHVPLAWRVDFNPATNPFGVERLGINAAFNPGAIELDGQIHLVARVEGVDRKSFFAVAESPNGIDRFRFWDYPLVMPETRIPTSTSTTCVWSGTRTAGSTACSAPSARTPWPREATCRPRSPSAASRGPRTSRPGSGSTTSRPARPSSEMSCCTPSSSTASTPSTPARRTASSRPAPAAASAGPWPTTWNAPCSARRRSSRTASTTRSTK